MPESITYVDVKARVIRAINQVTPIDNVSIEYQKDQTHTGNSANIGQILRELNGIRKNVENNILTMEISVG